jgi:hypothetical protein
MICEADHRLIVMSFCSVVAPPKSPQWHSDALGAATHVLKVDLIGQSLANTTTSCGRADKNMGFLVSNFRKNMEDTQNYVLKHGKHV